MVARPTLAVTGASGMLGGHFVRAAAARGHALRLMGRADATSDGTSLVHFDLADREPLDPIAFEGVDAVVHFAAHIPRDMFDAAEAERCFERNAMGTLRLLEAAQRGGVTHFINLVGANAYAPGSERPDETTQLLPTQRGVFYLMSKVSQEVFATHYGEANGIAVAALRVSTPFSLASPIGVIDRFAKSLLSGRTLQLANGGRYGTDWIDVDDILAAIFAALDMRLKGPINVGSGVRTTLAELVDGLAIALEIPNPAVELLPFDDPQGLGFPALGIERLRTLGVTPTPLPAALVRDAPLLRDALIAAAGNSLASGVSGDSH